MSLALIQSYSSAEEEEEKDTDSEDDNVEEEESGSESEKAPRNRNSSFPPLTKPTHSSLLPSALDAFAEIAGPPAFLNNSVGPASEPPEVGRRGRNGSRREKKDLPAGVVLEAKAQLVGIRDRVRSDMEASIPASAKSDTTAGEGKRVVSAANPDAKDAADLLRMCLQCGVPKTFAHTRGMVCPICGDRPKADPLKESDKKKGSTIKDKEKSKRMKGQSSHAAWKSETEMHLRQQYD